MHEACRKMPRGLVMRPAMLDSVTMAVIPRYMVVPFLSSIADAGWLMLDDRDDWLAD